MGDEPQSYCFYPILPREWPGKFEPFSIALDFHNHELEHDKCRLRFGDGTDGVPIATFDGVAVAGVVDIVAGESGVVRVADITAAERARPVVAVRVTTVEIAPVEAARSREENAVAVLLTGDFITADGASGRSSLAFPSPCANAGVLKFGKVIISRHPTR